MNAEQRGSVLDKELYCQAWEPYRRWNEVSEAEYARYRDDPDPPRVRLALIHYQFEAIHPFVDGNGRIGRLLISLLLIQWGLLPLHLLYLSAYFYRYRQEHYDRLLAVSERGAWRDWLLFFLRGVAAQASDAIERARKLRDLREKWRRRLTQAGVPSRTLGLVDMLFEAPILTIPYAARRLGATYHSAQRAVEKLVQQGILEPVGEASYGKAFQAIEILRAIGVEPLLA